jgi:hypothetical protein
MRSMRQFGSFALVIASIGFSGIAGAGPQDSAPARRLFGFQDLQTGAFHALPHPDAALPSTVVTGEYEIIYVVTLKSAFPKGTYIGCEADIEEDSSATIDAYPYELDKSYSEVGTASVAAGTAGSVECVVKIPYSWLIPISSATEKFTTTISGSYSVYAFNPSGTGTGIINDILSEGYRSTSSSLPVPATLLKTGTGTTITVDATL